MNSRNDFTFPTSKIGSRIRKALFSEKLEKLWRVIRTLPILVFADIADTDIVDILFADTSTDIADTDIFWSIIIISTHKYRYRYIDAI